MDPGWLSADFPRLFHVAEAGAWTSIRQLGLLSTSALLDLYEIEGEQRTRLERQHRPRGVPLTHPRLPPVVLRDQKPLNVKHLADCLDDGTAVEEWLVLLNRKVFFWSSEDRLIRLRAHDVLLVDTRPLVERYAAMITLTQINSGATGRARAKRGRRTFVPLALYPDDPGARRRIAEVAVEYAVPDVASYVLRVERRHGDRLVEPVWP